MSNGNGNGNGKPKKNGKPPPDKILHIKRGAFLAAFGETASIARAAEAAGIHRQTHYDWLNNDPEYPPLFAEARKKANDVLEDEAVRRARDGLKRFKFQKGEVLLDPDTNEPYYELEYSDTLLIFLMKGNDPEKWKDRSEADVRASLKVDVRAAGPEGRKGKAAQTVLRLAGLNGTNGNGHPAK